MCGLASTDEQHLPSWFKEIQDKKFSEHSKAMFIDDAISSNMCYKDADVECTPDLIKVVKKRDWMGGDTSKHLLFANAMKGLPPFTMLDLTEDEVANLVTMDAALQEASTTTVTDFKAKSASLAKVPL